MPRTSAPHRPRPETAQPSVTPDRWPELLGGRTPTPVQAGAIPALLAGRDVITTARTGSGKTLAFLIPAAARGIGMSAARGMRPEVLVITPTRELAVQIRDVARELGMPAGRITGGITPAQTRSEASGKGLIAGTPGRLKDLVNKGELDLRGLRYVVLDEADELLSLGFLKDVGDILRAAQRAAAPTHLQMAMASATFPAAIRSVAEQFMKSPERIDIMPDPTVAARADEDILGGATGATHLLVNTSRADVLDVTAEHVRDALKAPGGCVVIFCRTKHLVKRRAEQLQAMLPGELVSPLQGNMDQKKRERTMQQLRDGQSRVLIATDIAGRGIDLPEVRIVIHMDVAATAEDHVHRSGRTARAGRPGVNLVLLIPEQRALWQSIRRSLPAPLHPPVTREESQIDKEIQEKQGGGGNRGGASSGRSQGGRSQEGSRQGPGRSSETRGQSRPQGQPRDQGQARGSRDGGRSESRSGTGAGRVGPQPARRRR
ncbi:DEAD/DEAH box helicase [Deinococcus deserti]|uniref:Putative ATP-dependent RNA helicase n=1 Tax=Deinococcus deserti (strain DSM 17065 / CIP 109153 / LMG 22923 / VCD115) TaxID=546414 RepID=C1CZU2_DEIDV|nr:DEAD/DEAH box helicase [Deinococcus deserti]ACO45194.1 putative ATP-dependent RNA helicase [Deinococcus deserti VCD115]